MSSESAVDMLQEDFDKWPKVWGSSPKFVELTMRDIKTTPEDREPKCPFSDAKHVPETPPGITNSMSGNIPVPPRVSLMKELILCI
ncbi:unnamed protein product [Rhizoctonia solani]|uniref:Uncharacterized protein n=1 Tax=Rhizoctonia solani TaxID=456999 RepID=A0A8H3B052_9AGAM|nr:unnamed protein product [Rhizoctonia solani]